MESILIPGLPNDIALQCLFRLPFSQIHRLRHVCKAWNSEIKLSELFRLRRSDADFKPQPLIILHPLYYGSNCDNEKHRSLLVFDPETGFTSNMPPLPDSNKLPINCRTAVVGSKLVVIGGYDEETARCLDSVFIFDFYSSTWHCGANMPGGPGEEFACAAFDNRIVFLGGGRNTDYTFKSAWTYDMASNIWNRLPDTIKIQIYDISTTKWSETDSWFFGSYWQRNIVECSDQNYYKISGDDGRLIDDKRRFVATLPNNRNKSLGVMEQLVASPGQIWLICRDRYEEPYDSFRMDLNDRKWIKCKVSIKFCGPIDVVYSLII